MTIPLIFTSPSKKQEPVDRGSMEEIILDSLPSPRRVVARYLIRRAASDACRVTFQARTASANMTERVLVACAEAALVSMEGSQVRVGGLMDLPRKMLEMAKAIKKFPAIWDKLAGILGVHSLADLPGILKELVKQGYGVLRKALTRAFETWPLKLYSLPENELFGINKILESLMAKSPEFKKWLETSVKPRVEQFDAWLKEHLPTVSKVLMVGVYIWVWFNVVEFEWNLKGLLDAATGHLSLADFLSSFPGSVIGAVMNGLGLGTFTLLPAAAAVRLVFLMSHRYLSWTGSGFSFDLDRLRADFGIGQTA